MIARLNLGGPAHQAAYLSGGRMDPDRYETLLVHGRLAAGEQSMAALAGQEGATLRYLPTLGQPLDPLGDTRALASLARIIHGFRPDIVHTHTAKAGFVGRAAALSSRLSPKLVHTFHGHVLEGYFSPAKARFFRGLERRLGRHTDRLIGVSQATVDDLVRLGVAPRESFRVLPLGLDLAKYENLDPTAGRELRAEIGVAPDDTLGVFIGRVVPIKRLDVMLEAFAAANVSSHLAIVGDGETRADLERRAAGLRVADRVHFLGYRADLRPVFAAADLALLSSDNEGTPVSLIEAAAAGLPSVATDVGGVADVVCSEGGTLVPPQDPGAFAMALARLASNPSMRSAKGAAARKHVMSRYSVERLVTDVDRLYEELLAAPPV